MKTILIAHNYSKNSFSFMSYRLANHLSDIGFRVVFISHQPYFEKQKQIKKKSGELIITSWKSKKRPTGIKDVLWFRKVYKKYKPAYVIGHFVGANIAILISKILSFGTVKTFIYYHTLSSQIKQDTSSKKATYTIKKYRKMMFYKFLVDNYICPSELAKEDIINTFKIARNKTTVVLNAIEDRQETKTSRVKETAPKAISYLGRLEPSKNVKLLIASFIKFKRQHPRSNLNLHIAGAGSESKAIATICKKHSFLHFKGEIPYQEVDHFLSNSDFVILPSFVDNLPTVGIESLMNSTPLIISNKIGLAHYCSNIKDSIIFSPSEEEMVTIFGQISTKNLKLMRKGARTLFELKFKIERYCKEVEQLIESA